MSTGTKPKRRRGRPKVEAAPGTTVVIGGRAPAELKARLDRAAEASGRTQGEELVRRLTTSFELQPIKEIFSLVESISGRPWNDDTKSALMAVGLVNAYLRSIIPPGAVRYLDEPRAANVRAAETRQLDKALENLRESLGVPQDEETNDG